MNWTRQKTAIAVAAAVVLAGLIAGALLLLRGGQATVASGHSPRPAQLRSPFTGEPVRSLNRVLAAKIDNIVTRGRRPGSPTLTSSTRCRSKVG